MYKLTIFFIKFKIKNMSKEYKLDPKTNFSLS